MIWQVRNKKMLGTHAQSLVEKYKRILAYNMCYLCAKALEIEALFLTLTWGWTLIAKTCMEKG